MNKKANNQSVGQGLVEYALVLVLVSVVVIGILTVLGPQVGNVFSLVTSGLNGSTANSVIVTPPALPMVTNVSRESRHAPNVVGIRVWVSENTTVTITDDQGGPPVSIPCNNTCAHFMIVGGTGAGILTITAPGNSISLSYLEVQ